MHSRMLNADVGSTCRSLGPHANARSWADSHPTAPNSLSDSCQALAVSSSDVLHHSMSASGESCSLHENDPMQSLMFRFADKVHFSGGTSLRLSCSPL